MSRPVTQTFTTAQAGAVLLSVPDKARVKVTGVIIAAHDNMTAKPSAAVSLGGQIVAKHPGVPPGGGLVAMNMDCDYGSGADITFDCDDPTGGSLAVTVLYEL